MYKYSSLEGIKVFALIYCTSKHCYKRSCAGRVLTINHSLDFSNFHVSAMPFP